MYSKQFYRTLHGQSSMTTTSTTTTTLLLSDRDRLDTYWFHGLTHNNIDIDNDGIVKTSIKTIRIKNLIIIFYVYLIFNIIASILFIMEIFYKYFNRPSPPPYKNWLIEKWLTYWECVQVCICRKQKTKTVIFSKVYN